MVAVSAHPVRLFGRAFSHSLFFGIQDNQIDFTLETTKIIEPFFSPPKKDMSHFACFKHKSVHVGGGGGVGMGMINSCLAASESSHSPVVIFVVEK